MDEFALHKGHHYATVVVDPIGGQVLWIGSGPALETAQAFFEQFPEGVAERIESITIDMRMAYELEIKAPCPQAEIVFDLFHVVAQYGREVTSARQPLAAVFLNDAMRRPPCVIFGSSRISVKAAPKRKAVPEGIDWLCDQSDDSNDHRFHGRS
jgi:hypothetical protein